MQLSHHNYCYVVQDVTLDANGRWIKCVLNVKFIVFHMNFRKYLSFKLQKISELQKISKIVQICFFFKEFFFDKNVFSDNLFSKNFPLLSRPLHCIKVICLDVRSNTVYTIHWLPLLLPSSYNLDSAYIRG